MRNPRPTVRGSAAMLAFGVVVILAAVTGTLVLVPVAVVIGVPLVLAPWIARRRARFAVATAEIHGHAEPATVQVGSAMTVVLSLTNRTLRGPALPSLGLPPVDVRWRARGTRTGVPDRHFGMAPTPTSLSKLPTPGPGTTQSCHLPVPTGRRGVLELPPLRCWAYDPLGLFGAPGPHTPAMNAVVYPVAIDPGLRAGLGAPTSGDMATQVTSSGGGGLGDLEGIRPYVVGDRLSLLHWPARARYGIWFVRHFGTEGAAAVHLVLDDRAGVHRKADFERLVSAVLWALEQALHGGHPVLFLTLSGRSFSLEPSEQGCADARLILAELQPSSSLIEQLPSMSGGSVVVTTQTGAERLARSTGLAVEPANAAWPTVGRNAGQVVVV